MPHDLAEAAWMHYVVLACVVCVGAGGHVLWRRARADGQNVPGISALRPPYLLLVGGVAYLAFLAVSLSFFDAYTPLNDRILVPVYLAGVVSALWVANLAVASLHGESARKVALVCFCVICAVVFVPRGALHMLKRSRDGGNYTQRAWRESPTLKAALAIASSVPVYTNDPMAFYILGGARVHPLPPTVILTTMLPNRLYGEQSATMASDMREHGALIVCFRGHNTGKGLPSEEQLARELPLRPLQSFRDGAIYGIGPG